MTHTNDHTIFPLAAEQIGVPFCEECTALTGRMTSESPANVFYPFPSTWFCEPRSFNPFLRNADEETPAWDDPQPFAQLADDCVAAEQPPEWDTKPPLSGETVSPGAPYTTEVTQTNKRSHKTGKPHTSRKHQRGKVNMPFVWKSLVLSDPRVQVLPPASSAYQHKRVMDKVPSQPTEGCDILMWRLSRPSEVRIKRLEYRGTKTILTCVIGVIIDACFLDSKARS